MPRGSNFTEEEIQLCISYLKICEDPKTGTDQLSAAFWKRIHQHFTAARPTVSVAREIRSLECKWSKISGQAKMLSAAMDKAKHQSGASFEDEVSDAQSIYMRMEDRGGLTPSKLFKLLHCWRILRNEPLWTSYRGASQDQDSTAGVVNAGGAVHKAEKQQRRKQRLPL